MFREMRRKNNRMPAEDAVNLLFSNNTAVLSVNGDNGYPYAVPLNYVCQKQCEGIIIYFHSATSGHKIDAINANDKVSLCVVGRDELVPEKYTTNYSSVIAFGKAKVVDTTERIKALKLLVDKYSSDYAENIDSYIQKYESKSAVSVIKMTVEHITGKENRS